MQQLLFECPEEARPALVLKAWFPRVKCTVEQFDIFEPWGAATFDDLARFEPLLWKTAWGDSQDEREECFASLRAHVGRKLKKYRKVKGRGFAAWLTTVCKNWKAGELRKRKQVCSELTEAIADSTPGRDDVCDVETDLVFHDLAPELKVVYLWLIDEIGAKERNGRLKEIGFGQDQVEPLVARFKAIAVERLGLCVPKSEDGKRSSEPPESVP